MKKLSQRTVSVLVALPLMLTGTLALSTPASAAQQTPCGYQTPPPPSATETADVTNPSPAQKITYTCNTYVAPPAHASATAAVYSSLAEQYRVKAETYRHYALLMTWFLIGLSSVCGVALLVIGRTSKNKSS